MSTTQPIRDKKELHKLLGYFLEKGELRNYVLTVMGVNTALRIGDLIKLTWDDVYDFENHSVLPSVTLTEKKTGKSKIVALNKQIVGALTLYSPAAKHGCPLFVSRKGVNKAITRVQAYRILRAASEASPSACPATRCARLSVTSRGKPRSRRWLS